MGEGLEGKNNKKMSRGKAMLAAIGMVAAAEAAIPANTAGAQTIEQYSHDERVGQDPRIARLPKETTLFQTAGKGQMNIVDGATLDPKITHIYQTTRGGANIVKNKRLMRPDIVIIQEGGANVVSGEDPNITIDGRGNINVTGRGNAVSGEPVPKVEMPDKWPFTDKDNPFKKPGWPFNK
ncbi:MAG: hypothetical protein HYS26_04865 [Candidatus Kaiserbacteria bacterium]|nr:MAG: hypothetical protein HYS26_04865 [Candidatus Kaiserbacteria bacterium]